MRVILLAGGVGERLWPLSREGYPKQFLKLGNQKKSLFQLALERSLKLTTIDKVYVVTNTRYRFLVQGAFEELGLDWSRAHILYEPKPKNTLPAIYGAVYLMSKSQNDDVVVFPTDHYIPKDAMLIDEIIRSQGLSQHGIVTFGIMPTQPHTGYGYISKAEVIDNGYKVKSFIEKPSKQLAKEYIEKGYLWNAGIFMFKVEFFNDEVEKYAPQIFRAFNDHSCWENAFQQIEKGISIDYGILEKSEHVFVVPLEIHWNDLGSFDALDTLYNTDEYGNNFFDNPILIDAYNNLLISDEGKQIAAIGVKDLVIVDQRDALLICHKEKTNQVREVVGELKKRKDNRVIYHTKDYRPWGFYQILDQQKDAFKIKRITVFEGKKLSEQLHYHRSEHWIVVSGTAKVTINGEISLVKSGESIFIRAGEKHRLENPGKIPLEIIEVQMGEYLEEDDIVRFDDDFKRQ